VGRKITGCLAAVCVLWACAATGFRGQLTVLPKAYVVAEIDVKDPGRYREYAKAAFPIIQRYGGRFLTRGGTTVAVEGKPPTQRVMIIEFASLERARAFEHSREYSAIAPLRQASATSRLYIVEGTNDPAANRP
jgi:uncharacterized protein (DUF1330 family)